MSNGPWTDEENDLIVADCFAMLADDKLGEHSDENRLPPPKGALFQWLIPEALPVTLTGEC